MPRFEEWESVADTRNRMLQHRKDVQLNQTEVARIINAHAPEGYRLTPDMYTAVETGVTKNIPLWVMIAFMEAEELRVVDTNVFFPNVGAAWR